VTVDVAVVGAPFLDITFEGLPAVPRPGEELVARALHISPGGTGMQAIACARLGLGTVLVTPFPSDGPGSLMRGLLEREGVVIAGGSTGTLPVTALLSTPEGTAMATVMAGDEPTADDVAGVGARAVLCSLGRVDLAPPGARLYAVTGTLELDAVASDLERRLEKVDVLILDASEAARVTGATTPEEAGLQLASHGLTAVVTTGRDGAVSVADGSMQRAAAPEVTVADATGAGDLFAAAYAWAELTGAERPLEWACLYASLSVRSPTALDGALRLEDFLSEANARFSAR
jgi:sugar/nucleoside kinase (ribokinase family)